MVAVITILFWLFVHISSVLGQNEQFDQECNILQTLEALKAEIAALKQSRNGGSVYLRWERTMCPGNGTDLIYKGIIAGALWDTQKGGATSSLCLPEDPTWNNYDDEHQPWTSFIDGAEIEDHDGISATAFGYEYHDQDPPCAACRSQRQSVIMIPGRSNCYPGWTMEYTGYLMGGFGLHTSADYICLDSKPEKRTGGLSIGSDNKRILFFVEAGCGSLPCPPYQQFREVACVVCSM